MHPQPLVVVLEPWLRRVFPEQPSDRRAVAEAGADEVVLYHRERPRIVRQPDARIVRPGAERDAEVGTAYPPCLRIDQLVVGVDQRDVRPRAQERHEPRELLGQHQVVGRGPTPVLAMRQFEPGVQRARQALLRLPHPPQPRVGGMACDHRGDLGTGAVVDDDQLELTPALRQHAPDRRVEQVRLLVHRQHHRDESRALEHRRRWRQARPALHPRKQQPALCGGRQQLESRAAHRAQPRPRSLLPLLRRQAQTPVPLRAQLRRNHQQLMEQPGGQQPERAEPMQLQAGHARAQVVAQIRLGGQQERCQQRRTAESGEQCRCPQ